MGFPEVIMPHDVRNDLYVNLVRGEFHSGKTSNKNVEVCVSVHDDSGKKKSGVICSGSGVSCKDEYKSTVFRHNDKPKWNEYFKISLPMSIDDFSTSHIKFTFRHR